MDCYVCSESGKKLVEMNVEWDSEIGASVAICPECGRDEVIGFGSL